MRKLCLITMLLFLFTTKNKAQIITDSLWVNPNPFQNNTFINYSFIYNDTVSIYINNITGNNIITVFTNSIMPSGIYQYSLQMSSYPDGVYFLQLKLGSRKNRVQKLVKSSSVGIKQTPSDLETVKCSPNPVEDKLTIEFASEVILNGRIEIFNSLGESVYICDKLNALTDIDLSDLSGGVYFLHFETGSQQKVIKFLKR